MNIYVGKNRRQIGGGIWSTITRGLTPILKSMKETLKPIGNKLAQRAAKSAINVGTSLATDAIFGKIDKSAIKTKLRDEANQLKDEGFKNLKRKLGVQEGEGVPRKRRRMSPKVAKTTRKQVSKSTKRKKSRKFPKKSKIKQTKSKRRVKKSINKKRKTKRKKISSRKGTVSRKAIKDLFG